jgi:hypothetical protein
MIRTGLLAIAMVAAGGSQQNVVLKSTDGDVDICPFTGFSFDGGTLTVDVQFCSSDIVFRNGFET